MGKNKPVNNDVAEEKRTAKRKFILFLGIVCLTLGLMGMCSPS